ncbi:uncharacterized protein LOC130359987 [Hyla sarda]|uniref:uncharacterized protein LOC130359987 n=1 Tax=Hyla sarda TaxID=327740 RepID=UPI0024C3885E|nr:uncharacterized protein LOC130359987 [Hyla sarda]
MVVREIEERQLFLIERESSSNQPGLTSTVETTGGMSGEHEVGGPKPTSPIQGSSYPSSNPCIHPTSKTPPSMAKIFPGWISRQHLHLYYIPHLLSSLQSQMQGSEGWIYSSYSWFLASSESFPSLHFQFCLGISTICGIVRNTCEALWDCLLEDFFPQPSPEHWLDIAEKFQEVTQLPNCVGAIDGKHIRIQKPAHKGSEYYNYKTFFSTILMAIADAQYRLIAVGIGSYERTTTPVCSRHLPWGGGSTLVRWDFLKQGPFLGLIVRDEAFQMCANLLKPYSSRGLDEPQQIFNYRLSRARLYVECAFAIFASKWRLFTWPFQLHPDVVDQVVKAAVVLHNFELTKEPHPSDPKEVEVVLPGLEQSSRRSTQAVMSLRDDFARYFLTEAGRVSWQDRMF